MTTSVNRYCLEFLVVSVLFVAVPPPTQAQDKKPACGARVKWMVPPKFTEGDIAKWKGKELSGTVNLLVGEGGEIIQARVRSVKPKEATAAFLSAVQQGKFQARPGCGDWKIEVTFKLRPD